MSTIRTARNLLLAAIITAVALAGLPVFGTDRSPEPVGDAPRRADGTLPGGAAAGRAAAQESNLERLLAARYGSSYYVLREPVKVRDLRIRDRKVAPSLISENTGAGGFHQQVEVDLRLGYAGSRGSREEVRETRSITVVTTGGVHYVSDPPSDEETVRAVVPGGGQWLGPAPGLEPYSAVFEWPAPRQVDVQRVSSRTRVALDRGRVTRCLRFRERARGVSVELECPGGNVQVLLHGDLGSEAPLADRLRELDGLAAHLLRLPDGGPGAGPATGLRIESASPAREPGVEIGMSRDAVLRSWGSPVHVTQDGRQGEIWLFIRGGGLLGTDRRNVHFVDGRVVDVEAIDSWRAR